MLGIEAVEWFAEGGENLTLRVTGRWRRRRPAWSGQPMLVIESSGRRHRFPAMPEPPSLTGAGPGTWRLSFTVPAVLAPELGGRVWLQFGSVVVQLPAAVEPAWPGDTDVEDTGDQTMSQPGGPGGGSPRSSELEIEGLRRRAREAEEGATRLSDRVRAIEDELGAARRAAERLSESLTERDTARRAAEQRAHAEQALRRDLARQLVAQAGEEERVRQALGELASAEARIRELEDELLDARRRGDEAEQLAAAAGAARERAEQQARESERRARAAEQQAHDAVQQAHDTVQQAHDAEQDREGHTVGLGAQAAPADQAALSGQAAPVGRPDSGETGRLRSEHELVTRRERAARRIPSEPAPAAILPAAVGPQPEQTSGPGQEALIVALRRELDARAGTQAALRARLVAAEARVAARPLIDRRTRSTLALLREELDGLRYALQRERAARIAAETKVTELSLDASGQRDRSRQTYDAIADLRQALEALRAAPHPADPVTREPQAEDPVQTDPFNDARLRLREAIAPPDTPDEPQSEPAGLPHQARPQALVQPDAEARAEDPRRAETPTAPDGEPAPLLLQRTGRPWLAPVLRALARADADRAGRLLLELLPAQQEAFPDPVSYDLVLGGPAGCVRVTARQGQTVIRRADGPRPASEVDFQVFGEPAAIMRLAAAGPLRRRLRRGLARVSGRRDRVAALRSLVDLRLDLADLYRAGVRLEPGPTLRIVALAIEPAWTARERFTLAYTVDGGATAYLLVRDGQRTEVADEAPGGRVATTISGPPEALAAALSGEPSDQLTVTGDQWPLDLLRKWIKRAQSD